ncbi:MAG: indolepyruvate oxidoreductase subunit beta [Deltaproteobacteria bacterium]|nr:indolepyruvate oxidoreductase subunit beta [Deltaproteobacteria bacterium]
MSLQMIFTGVGGQGVLFATRVFYELAHTKGESVFGSETHGMSQRGGSVVSHLKIGPYHSPLVARGRADVLFGFQKEEGLRNLPMVRRGGAAIINTPGQLPQGEAKEKGIAFYVLDADGLATEIGNPLAANLVLIGYGISTVRLPYTYEEIKEVVSGITPPRLKEANLMALEVGYSSAGP